jgi:hypothetical protein
MDDIDELLTEISNRVFLKDETPLAKVKRLLATYEDTIFKPSELYFKAYTGAEGEILVLITPIEYFNLTHTTYRGQIYLPELYELAINDVYNAVTDMHEGYKGTLEELRQAMIHKGFVELPMEDFKQLVVEILND